MRGVRGDPRNPQEAPLVSLGRSRTVLLVTSRINELSGTPAPPPPKKKKKNSTVRREDRRQKNSASMEPLRPPSRTAQALHSCVTLVKRTEPHQSNGLDIDARTHDNCTCTQGKYSVSTYFGEFTPNPITRPHELCILRALKSNCPPEAETFDIEILTSNHTNLNSTLLMIL